MTAITVETLLQNLIDYKKLAYENDLLGMFGLYRLKADFCNRFFLLQTTTMENANKLLLTSANPKSSPRHNYLHQKRPNVKKHQKHF